MSLQDDDEMSCYALEGYLRRDIFGRVYIDTCETDHEHLTSPLPAGQERHRCRKYLDDMLPIPNTDLGKRVKLVCEIHVKVFKES